MTDRWRERQTDRQERERERIKKSDTYQKWSEIVACCDDFLSDVALDQERNVVRKFFFNLLFVPTEYLPAE